MDASIRWWTFAWFYRFYSREERLSRVLLRELTFYTEGQNSARFQAIRQITIEAVEKLVTSARVRGELKTHAQDAEIARVIFYVFAAEIRRWLGQEMSSVDEGLRKFGELLRVVLKDRDMGR